MTFIPLHIHHMPRKGKLRHGVALGALLLILSQVPLDGVANVLTAPIDLGEPPVDSASGTEQSKPVPLPRPDPVVVAADPKTTPNTVDDLAQVDSLDPVPPVDNLSAHQVAASLPDAPELEADVPGSTSTAATAEDQAHLLGEQDGVVLPALDIRDPSPGLVRSLIDTRRINVMLYDPAGGTLWFVPADGVPPDAGSVRFYGTGSLTRDPKAANLPVVAHDGGQLRQSGIDHTSTAVPLTVIARLARDMGVVPTPSRGELRVSPDAEAELVAAQHAALNYLGIDPSAPNTWPEGLRMVGCWTTNLSFTVTDLRSSAGHVTLPEVRGKCGS